MWVNYFSPSNTMPSSTFCFRKSTEAPMQIAVFLILITNAFSHDCLNLVMILLTYTVNPNSATNFTTPSHFRWNYSPASSTSINTAVIILIFILYFLFQFSHHRLVLIAFTSNSRSVRRAIWFTWFSEPHECIQHLAFTRRSPIQLWTGRDVA